MAQAGGVSRHGIDKVDGLRLGSQEPVDPFHVDALLSPLSGELVARGAG